MAGEESSSLRTVVSIRNAGAGENQNEIIQSNPSPEFLNSLSFIKKFYPLPAGARAKFTKVTHDNSCNSRHSERQRKNPAYLLYNTSKLKGIVFKVVPISQLAGWVHTLWMVVWKNYVIRLNRLRASIAFKVIQIPQWAGWAAHFVNGCLKKLCHKTEWLRASIAFKVVQISQWAGWAARSKKTPFLLEMALEFFE